MSQVNKSLGDRIEDKTWQWFPGLFAGMVISFGIAMVILAATSLTHPAFILFTGIGIVASFISLAGMVVSIVKNFT